MRSKQIPSHLNHARCLLGCTKAGEGSMLYDLCSSADLNQHCWLQDQGSGAVGEELRAGTRLPFPTQASSVSESVPGAAKLWPTKTAAHTRSQSSLWSQAHLDYWHVTFWPQESCSAPRSLCPHLKQRGQWQWQCYLAFSTDVCVRHHFSWACVCECMFIYVGAHVWSSKDNLGCQSSDGIHHVVFVCLFLQSLRRLDWWSHP